MSDQELQSLIDRLKSEIVPVGSIMCFASPKCPTDYLPCDGRELPKPLFPDLYKVIGDTFGQPKESDGFLLPDLRGQFVRGYDDEGDLDPERKFGEPQEDAFQGHSHEVSSCSENGSHYHYVAYKSEETLNAMTFFSTEYHHHVCNQGDSRKAGNYNTDKNGNHKHEIVIGLPTDSIYQGVRVSTETRPKNIALLYCIKVR